MLVSSVCAAGMHAAIKYIAFQIHPFEIFFLRQSIALFLLIPIFINIGFAALRTDRLTGHILRGVCMTAGGMAWFWAISLVPLAKVTALNLSAVLFTILGAIIFLKEVSELKRWAALIFWFRRGGGYCSSRLRDYIIRYYFGSCHSSFSCSCPVAFKGII